MSFGRRHASSLDGKFAFHFLINCCANSVDPRLSLLFGGAQHEQIFARVKDLKALLRKTLLAQAMKDGGCPFSLGSNDKLNDAGELMGKMLRTDALNKLDIDECVFDLDTADEDSEDMEWRTFRDLDPRGVSSLITGAKAVPLPGRQMDLDDEGRIPVNAADPKDLTGNSSTKPFVVPS
jgi:hypothetical protein